jgi:hypothetical protein
MWRSNDTSQAKLHPPHTRARNGTTVITSTADVAHATKHHNNDDSQYHCHDINSSTNTVVTASLKHPPQTQQTPISNSVMADIPLRHSSHTRTLLPGLRRKSSIRRPTQRSRWYSIQEQMGQYRFFSLSFLLPSCIATGNSTSGNSQSDTVSSSSQTPIVIKPPKHTQRILKYDPITGNAYSNPTSNSRHRNFIQITVLGMIPRNKVLRSIWKLTLLLTFVYINLNLIQLKQEHHQISHLLSSITSTDHYQHQSSHYRHDRHHRALRGSISTTGSDVSNDSEYYSNRNDSHKDTTERNQQRSSPSPHSSSDVSGIGTNHASNYHHSNNHVATPDDVVPGKLSRATSSASRTITSSNTTNNIDNSIVTSKNIPQHQQQPQEDESEYSSNHGHDHFKGNDETLIDTISMATTMQ